MSDKTSVSINQDQPNRSCVWENAEGILTEWMSLQPIYLDHAATTRLDDRVLDRMRPFLGEAFGNPSSVHVFGRRARAAVEEARDSIAEILGVHPSEIIFTSGGTESNNLALSIMFCDGGPNRLVTSAAEHDSVIRTAEYLATTGTDVTILPASVTGSAVIVSLKERVSGHFALVSLMHANNETGALNDLKEAHEIVANEGGILHSDCVQSISFFDAKSLIENVDMMTLSGHKLGGPKGSGLLYMASEVPDTTLLYGGGQERGRRSGTENVAAIIGLAEAIRLSSLRTDQERRELKRLRELLRELLKSTFGTEVRFSTPVENSAPHILHTLFSGTASAGLDAEMLILGLDMEGVHVSAGSACSSGAVSPSHVLSAMNVPEDLAGGAVRFSLSFDTAREEIEETVRRTTRVLGRLKSTANS